MFEDNFHQEQTKELAKALRIALTYLDWDELSMYLNKEDFNYLNKWWDIVHKGEV